MTIQQIGNKYKKKKVIFSRGDRDNKKEILSNFRGKFDHRAPPPSGPRTVSHEKTGHFAVDRFIKSGIKLKSDTTSLSSSSVSSHSQNTSKQLPSTHHSSICTSPISITSPSERHMNSIKMKGNVYITTGRLFVAPLAIHSRDYQSPIRPRTGSNSFQKITMQ